KKSPLLVMWYRPHWTAGAYDLRMLELPPYEEGCFEKAEVGVNPDATYDCDFIRGDIRKVAWVGMKEKWPAATKLLSELTLTDEEQVEMVTAIDQEGASLEQVAADWLAKNETRWEAWVAE